MLRHQDGFTIIEITIATLILSAVVLGIGTTTGRMLSRAGAAELEFTALQSVEDRLAQIRLDPRYASLDSVYSAAETGLPGLANITRTTAVTRFQVAQTGGGTWDYTEVVVTASGGLLSQNVLRQLIIGAP